MVISLLVREVRFHGWFLWLFLRPEFLPDANPHFYSPNAGTRGRTALPGRAMGSPSAMPQFRTPFGIVITIIILMELRKNETLIIKLLVFSEVRSTIIFFIYH